MGLEWTISILGFTTCLYMEWATAVGNEVHVQKSLRDVIQHDEWFSLAKGTKRTQQQHMVMLKVDGKFDWKTLLLTGKNPLVSCIFSNGWLQIERSRRICA